MTVEPAAVEWVSFVDHENTTWLFDLTFLRSGWRCTFGTTCVGTEPGDNGERGCCAHGAHLIDDDEQSMVVERAAALDASIWYHRDEVTADADLFDEVDGELTTRRIDEACIFLNPSDFEGGHGCALHIGALAAGERPIDWKPAVCWQLPFRLEEYQDGSGTRTVAVRAWRRSDWGEGGAAFEWWCTDDLPDGADGTRTWEHHLDELVELVGEEPVEWLVDYLRTSATQVAVEITRR